MTDSFPRQYARTQRFALGEPRNITIASDGNRIVFLRSSAGDDPVNGLWVKELPSGNERLVADPRKLRSEGAASGPLTDDERTRRERTRDGSSGITSFATDAACQLAAFELGGEIYIAKLASGCARHLPVEGQAFDPRPDPTARRLAYVRGRELRISELDGSSRTVAGSPSEADTVSWGTADFIAAEEMHRLRGYWWSPDGTRLAVCRVDTSPVVKWTIADPARPDEPARTIRYPAAGTANADVSLHLVDLDGSRVEVGWDRKSFPYLAHVEWTDAGLIMSCQSRDQRRSIVVRVPTGPEAVEQGTVEGEVVSRDNDDAWVENVPGLPRLDDGQLLTHTDEKEGVRRLLLDGKPITPVSLQVRSVVGVLPGDPHSCDESERIARVVLIANDPQAPTETHVWLASTEGDVTPATTKPGMHTAWVGGTTVTIKRSHLGAPGSTFTIYSARGNRLARIDTTIDSLAERPLISPNVELMKVSDRDLAVAVLFPRDFDTQQATERLPVLLDPYGGPHAQRVVASHNAMLASQWFADQGYCVIVCDGRGTPGRGAEWERSVCHDFVTPVLDDQIDALRAVADRFGCLNLRQVAIRGWSFGGYLAALAVLKRPDVFHAAIAGAPVTEWRLYDTHYTERYLGDPGEAPGVYDANSLFPLAGDLERPLLLIHGLADDNVVAAHTLQLSSALLAAGKSHEVLPLAGVTHMTPQEEVAENLLLHQLDFLRRSLPAPHDTAHCGPQGR